MFMCKLSSQACDGSFLLTFPFMGDILVKTFIICSISVFLNCNIIDFHCITSFFLSESISPFKERLFRHQFFIQCMVIFSIWVHFCYLTQFGIVFRVKYQYAVKSVLDCQHPPLGSVSSFISNLHNRKLTYTSLLGDYKTSSILFTQYFKHHT